jgi:hypothetical protein
MKGTICVVFFEWVFKPRAKPENYGRERQLSDNLPPSLRAHFWMYKCLVTIPPSCTIMHAIFIEIPTSWNSLSRGEKGYEVFTKS